MSICFDSANNGIILPSKTTIEKNSIVPTTGLVLYDSTLSSLQIYDSAQTGYYARYKPTNFVLASNVVTCTCVNDFSANDVIMVTNVNATGFSALLEGKTFTVSTANGTSFTFPYVNGNVASAANTRGYIGIYKTRPATTMFNSLYKGNIQLLFYDDFLFINTQLWSASLGSGIILEGVGSTQRTNNVQNAIYYWTSPVSYPAGRYFFDVTFVKYGRQGVFDIDVSCGGGDYMMLMKSVDFYDPNYGTKVPLKLYFTTSTAGVFILRFTNTGKNLSSSGYVLNISQPFMLYSMI